MPIRVYRVRLTQCSCVDVSSLDLVIHGCTLYGSSSSRMSTRQLPVILCVSRFECTLYPVMYCLVCLWWLKRFIVNLRLQACQYLKTFSKSFPYYPPPATTIGYPTTLRSRFVRVVVFTDYFITLDICIICQFAALLLLVTSLAMMHCDVLEPQPGVTTVKADLFLALGVQDWFPAALSATLLRLGFIYGSAS